LYWTNTKPCLPHHRLSSSIFPWIIFILSRITPFTVVRLVLKLPSAIV
jgi:hypothetical protein